MITKHFEGREDWLNNRLGKITGTRLKDIVSKGGFTKDQIAKELEARKIEFKKSDKKVVLQNLLPQDSIEKLYTLQAKKIGFYELIAERLMVTEEDFDGYMPDETPMDRGTRLQSHAIDRFEKETGNKVDQSLVMWVREDNDRIAISPDGVVSESEALECKCLSSARHVEAWHTNAVPDEYYMQILQYFCVNDQCEKVYMVFYDPRLPAIQYFVIETKRVDVQEEAEEYLKHQKRTLLEVDAVVNQLTNF